MLRVGLVGSGNMGTLHAAGWSRTPAHMVGIYSTDTTRAGKLAEQYGMTVYDSYAALLQAVDVIDICTPTDLHYEMVMTAARAGKHIICEKPLALKADHMQEMLAACEKAGVILLVAQVVRFFPEYAQAKATIERGDIGRVAVVRLTRCSFQPKLGADNWFLDPAKSGGMMMDLMVHDFDYARWVAGEVTHVYAKNARTQNPVAPGDYALVILEHENGAISNIEGGWAYPLPMFRTALEIAGDEGLIEHPVGSSLPLGLYMAQEAGSNGLTVGIPMSPLSEDPYTTQIKHFYEVLANDAKPRVTAHDGMMAVRIALAAIESAKTGNRVNVQDVR